MSDFSELARYADMHLREYAEQVALKKEVLSPEMLQQRRRAYEMRAEIVKVIGIVASDENIAALVAQQTGAKNDD